MATLTKIRLIRFYVMEGVTAIDWVAVGPMYETLEEAIAFARTCNKRNRHRIIREVVERKAVKEL